MPNAEPCFEVEVATIEEFLHMLKDREYENTGQNGYGVTRKAVFLAQMMDQRPSNYGFSLVRRYVTAAFAYGRDRVSYTRTTSNAIELPETVTKTEDRQQAAYEEVREEVERGLESLNLRIPVREGFLCQPRDGGRGG